MTRYVAAGVVVLTLVVAAGCPSNSQLSRPPPVQQFYFPTGIVHVASSASSDGWLFVANANFDKRFVGGSVTTVDLSRVGLPTFGQPVVGAPPQLTALGIDDAGVALISSFSGEMTALALDDRRVRLFIPSRSEGMKFHALDATLPATSGAPVVLSCSTPSGDGPNDCATNAPSLSPRATEYSTTGLPRAPGPFGVGVGVHACDALRACSVGRCEQGRCVQDGAGGVEPVADVFVTHITQADSPTGSTLNTRGYLVKLDATQPTVTDSAFIDIGPGASSSVVVGRRFAFVTGRFISTATNLLRIVDTASLATSTPRVLTPTLPPFTEARGLALSSDERRLYMAMRGPDALLVAVIDDPEAPQPVLQPLCRGEECGITLPSSPNSVQAISRPGARDLVLVTCSGNGGSLAFYDDQTGTLATEIIGVGLTPFGIAVDRRGAGARVYVSNFDDGRIAVIDVPDLAAPSGARLVAHLGDQQLCLTQGLRNPQLCDGGVR
ncbi:MAG: hypothetical protein JNG84_04195 [Archangium sp.]|nr:hypothetical protein [Archangium sp.]